MHHHSFFNRVHRTRKKSSVFIMNSVSLWNRALPFRSSQHELRTSVLFISLVTLIGVVSLIEFVTKVEGGVRGKPCKWSLKTYADQNLSFIKMYCLILTNAHQFNTAIYISIIYFRYNQPLQSMRIHGVKVCVHS